MMLASRVCGVAVVIGVCAASAGQPASAQTADPNRLSLEELLQAQVSAEATTDQALLRRAASVYVITRQDIGGSGMTTLPDLLRMVPGVWVAQIDASAWRITSRGTDSLQVLIDGHPLASSMFGMHWEMLNIPVREIERIEVANGLSGALWGVNGATTVINIITRAWDGAQGGLLTGAVGSSRESMTTARYVSRLGDRGRIRVHGDYARRGSGRVVRGIEDPDRVSVGLGDVRLDWRGTADTIRFRASLQDGESRHLSSSGPAVLPLGRESTSFTEGNAAFAWTRGASGRPELGVEGQYRAYTRADRGTREHWQFVDGDVTWRRAIAGRHRLTTGVRYLFAAATIDAQPYIGVRTPERTHVVSGVFRDDIAIGDRWQFTPGTTIEHNEYAGLEAQPSIRITWTPTDTQAVWWAASRGVATLSRVASAVPALDRSLEFRSELARGLEAGYRVQAGRRSLDAVAFATRRDERHLAGGSSRAPLESYAHGVEVAANWRPFTWWQLSGAYGALQLATPHEAPRHQAQIRTMFDTGSTQVNAALFHVSGVSAPQVNGYTRLDLRFEHEFGTRLELSIGLRNLLHGDEPEFDRWAGRYIVPARTTTFAELEWGF